MISMLSKATLMGIVLAWSLPTAFAASATGEAVVYSFKAGKDGRDPAAALIEIGGVLYGTTQNGGANDDGTVFSVTPRGVEKVLYSFTSNPDGMAVPSSALLNVGGTLYGTTSQDAGGVFSITLDRVEHSFAFSSAVQGYGPEAGLSDVGGTLYGTTSDGGTYGAGMVFAMTKGGARKVIYSFRGGRDGSHPFSGLVGVGGVLYGTTSSGGSCPATGGGSPVQCGVVFSVTPHGVEKVLYRFKGAPHDGIAPIGNLTNVNGVLYGTTNAGGPAGFGVVFSITRSGVEKIIHSFVNINSKSERYPAGGLIDVGGILYGTTSSGGDCMSGGTVFSITPRGVEKVVHSFCERNGDGVEPVSGLINVNGILFGTTFGGGSFDQGAVVSIRP
jgi:uncharacterized repeat protein (TIGR03803 family)